MKFRTLQRGVMKGDIRSQKDIEQLVNTFYERINNDERLGYIFNKVAGVNWDSHLKVMYNFWGNIILFTGNYEGNPMNLHQHINHLKPLQEIDFERWNDIFISTVDALFEGPNSKLAKQRAINISDVMKANIVQEESGGDKIY